MSATGKSVRNEAVASDNEAMFDIPAGAAAASVVAGVSRCFRSRYQPRRGHALEPRIPEG